MSGIEDVPCLSCQKGYGSPHRCDEPRYCACDQVSLHESDAVDIDLDLPVLETAIHVPEEVYDHLNGSLDQDVTVEMTLDGEVVVALHWPHDGNKVDRDLLHQTLTLASGAIDQILDQMEAPK